MCVYIWFAMASGSSIPETAAPCIEGSRSQSPQMPAAAPTSKTHGPALRMFIGTPAPHSCSRCATGAIEFGAKPALISNARRSSRATRSSTSCSAAPDASVFVLLYQ